MGYRYKLPSGAWTIADTAEGVLELDRLVLARSGAPVVNEHIAAAIDPLAWNRFVALVEDREPQLNLLRFMRARGEQPATLTEMANAIGVKTTSVAGGTVSGIRKNTKKAKLPNTDAVLCKGKDGTYTAGPALLMFELPPAERTTRFDVINAGGLVKD